MTAGGIPLYEDGAGTTRLREHLRARLPQQAPDALPGHDDYDFLTSRPEAFAAVKAAVLLPLIQRNEPALLFTRRTESLARHSGQVSFPGGRSEPHDLSPVETALRETFEETGIASSFVTVAGYLDRYLTGTGFDIQPVVGLVAEGFALMPDPQRSGGRSLRCRWPSCSIPPTGGGRAANRRPGAQLLCLHLSGP